MSARTASFVAFVLLSLCSTIAAANPADAASDESALVRAALAAAGVADPIDRTLDQRAVQHEIDRIVAEFGPGRPTYRRARRLHAWLHRSYLHTYVEEADHLRELLDEGRFNCLSGTLLYGLVARRLGYGVSMLEAPGHLLVRLDVNGRPIDVEITARHGFDARRPSPIRTPATLRASEGPLPEDLRIALPLEAAVGFAWLNRAWRSLGMGRSLAAAEQAVAAIDHLPNSLIEDAGIVRLLGQAFRAEYEDGRFRDAFRIAVLEVRHFPERTTSRDRLLAAGVKRIEDACDDDDPRLAEAVLASVESLLGASPDAERLIRRTAPLIAACAVRLESWDLAQRAAERYAAVEPDRLEARRLLDWVESRRAGDDALVPFGRSEARSEPWAPHGLPR